MQTMTVKVMRMHRQMKSCSARSLWHECTCTSKNDMDAVQKIRCDGQRIDITIRNTAAWAFTYIIFSLSVTGEDLVNLITVCKPT